MVDLCGVVEEVGRSVDKLSGSILTQDICDKAFLNVMEFTVLIMGKHSTSTVFSKDFMKCVISSSPICRAIELKLELPENVMDVSRVESEDLSVYASNIINYWNVIKEHYNEYIDYYDTLDSHYLIYLAIGLNTMMVRKVNSTKSITYSIDYLKIYNEAIKSVIEAVDKKFNGN